jgi:hypothetical protein
VMYIGKVADAVCGVSGSDVVTMITEASGDTNPFATGFDDVTPAVADSSEAMDMVPVDADSDVMDPVLPASCDVSLAVADSSEARGMVSGVSFSVDVTFGA